MIKHISDYAGKRVHFIGVGGSSMSGLALLLNSQGYIVSGSDWVKSHKTDALEKKGLRIYIGNSEKNVHGADIIVFSAAVAYDNCERAEGRKLGIPEIERCDLIGQLMDGNEFAIGVSGTHGKTTTTSMLAQVFMECKDDPTIHIGGELDFIGGSTRAGSGSFICEACEFNKSFLHFHPTVAVILNIDEDHLDFYGNIDNIERAFADFVALLPDDGVVIGWGDDFRVKRVMDNSNKKYISYGLNENNALRPINLTYDSRGRASYDAQYNGKTLCHVDLGVSSEANMLDSLAVVACAIIRGLDMSIAAKALNEFTGAHRRFEMTGEIDGVALFTDYGHNPAEIKNAVRLALMQPHKRVWSVWQPHTFSRTKTLFNQFIETFDGVDKLLVTEICASREKDPGDINSNMLIEPLRERGIDAYLTPTFDDAEKFLRENWREGDVVVTHGCGDIDLLNEQISLHGDTKGLIK